MGAVDIEVCTAGGEVIASLAAGQAAVVPTRAKEQGSEQEENLHGLNTAVTQSDAEYGTPVRNGARSSLSTR